MGFHGEAAADKPHITKRNAKHWMKWCKACHHWILEQWRCVLWSDKSRFTGLAIFDINVGTLSMHYTAGVTTLLLPANHLNLNKV